MPNYFIIHPRLIVGKLLLWMLARRLGAPADTVLNWTKSNHYRPNDDR